MRVGSEGIQGYATYPYNRSIGFLAMPLQDLRSRTRHRRREGGCMREIGDSIERSAEPRCLARYPGGGLTIYGNADGPNSKPQVIATGTA